MGHPSRTGPWQYSCSVFFPMKGLVRELEQLTLELCGYVLVPGNVGGSSLCNPYIDSFQRDVPLKPICQSTTERQGSGTTALELS